MKYYEVKFPILHIPRKFTLLQKGNIPNTPKGFRSEL